MLQVETMSCKEHIIFDACIKWANGKCRRRMLDASQPKRLRTELGECFGLIRFKEMDPLEFASRFELFKGIFTKDESDDIFLHYLRSNEIATSNRYGKNPIQIWCCEFEKIERIKYELLYLVFLVFLALFENYISSIDRNATQSSSFLMRKWNRLYRRFVSNRVTNIIWLNISVIVLMSWNDCCQFDGYFEIKWKKCWKSINWSFCDISRKMSGVLAFFSHPNVKLSKNMTNFSRPNVKQSQNMTIVSRPNVT